MSLCMGSLYNGMCSFLDLSFVRYFVLLMNVLSSAASERPVEVYKRIFDEAGLELVRVYPMRSWVWAMEGRKKHV
jgi:hypothetical protein